MSDQKENSNLPSMSRVVADLLRFRAIGGSLIRPATEGAEVAVSVFMIGKLGVRAFGLPCLKIAELSGASANDPAKFILGDEQSVSALYDWMKENGKKFCYAERVIAGHDITIAHFIGADLCEPLAESLNALGLPTILKREQYPSVQNPNLN